MAVEQPVQLAPDNAIAFACGRLETVPVAHGDAPVRVHDVALALKRARWYNGTSPDGQSLLYYDDGHFFVHNMATGQAKNITHSGQTVLRGPMPKLRNAKGTAKKPVAVGQAVLQPPTG